MNCFRRMRGPLQACSFAGQTSNDARLFSVLAIALGLTAGLPQCCRAEPAGNPPNVLFLAVDDMKDWVGCLGGYEGTVHTPNIDRLAKKGILFRNAHCPSPKCAPSRAAILTGLRPSSTGLYDNGHWWLPNLPGAITIPAHFGQHGFDVVGAGKIFHHTAGNHPPNQWRQFQRITFRNDPWFRGAKLNYPWSKVAPYPDLFPLSGVEGLGHENDWGSLAIPTDDYDDAHSASFAVDYLARSHSQPFFLACGLFRPHLPWYAPQEFFELYPLDEIVLPKVKPDDLTDVPKAGQTLANDRKRDFELIKNRGRWKHAIRAYLASISFADHQLGRVLDALQKSDACDDTIIVLWSDHGWHLGSKGHWHKSTLWEEATRVPLIIAAPGRSAGVCDAPVNLLDLFPTLVDLCQISKPGELDGRSLTPLLSDPSARWEFPTVIEFRRGNAAVRDNRFRYIRYADGGEELYDHRSDPREWHNLASSPPMRSTIERLARSLPRDWAPSAETKRNFDFDSNTFRWTHKKTGVVTDGKSQLAPAIPR